MTVKITGNQACKSPFALLLLGPQLLKG